MTDPAISSARKAFDQIWPDAQKLMAEVAAPLLYSHRVIGKQCTCGARVKLPSDAWYARHMGEVLAAEIDKALGGLTQEWSVAGDCSLAPGKSCDHFGDHGPWTCDAVAETREGAEAFPVAKQPDAHIESRWVSGYTEVTEWASLSRVVASVGGGSGPH